MNKLLLGLLGLTMLIFFGTAHTAEASNFPPGSFSFGRTCGSGIQVGNTVGYYGLAGETQDAIVAAYDEDQYTNSNGFGVPDFNVNPQNYCVRGMFNSTNEGGPGNITVGLYTSNNLINSPNPVSTPPGTTNTAFIDTVATTYTLTPADLTATVGPAMSGIQGSTQTFTGTVTDASGAGTASANFWNLLQVCDSGVLVSGNCSTYDITTNGDYYTSAIGPGSSGALSYSGAIPETAGAYAYRWCANYQTVFNVSSDAESNYGNNCSGWATLTSIPVPTASLSASPASITQGGSSALISSCTNSTSASITYVGAVSATNATTAVYPSSTTTYTLTCSGAGGTAYASAAVTVSPPPAPAAGLSANNPNITAGGSTTLNWACTNSTSASISPAPGSVTPVSGGTTGAVSPSTSTTYTLTCSGAGGTATASAVVSVTQLPDLTATYVAGQKDLTGTTNSPVSLNAIISNIGAGATNVPFTTTFWVNSSQTKTGATTYEFTSGVPGGFPAGYGEEDGYQAPITATFSSPGTYYYRVCANEDQNSSYGVTESNYSNNCFPLWGTITITAPPALSASCSVSPATATTNQSVTWTASASGGTPPYSYNWIQNYAIALDTAQSISASYPNAGTQYGSLRVDDSGAHQGTSPSTTYTQGQMCTGALIGTIFIDTANGGTEIQADNEAKGEAKSYLKVTPSAQGDCVTGNVVEAAGSSSFTITDSLYSGTSEGAQPANPGYTVDDYGAGIYTPASAPTSQQSVVAICSNSVAVAAPLPDLSATVGSAVSGTPGSTQTFTGTVTNSGAGPAPANFWNLLQVCDSGVLISGNCSSYDTITNGDYYTSAIAVGGSGPLSYSGPIPATAGAYAYRWCANYQTPFVVSSDAETNYGNNCSSWTTLTASYPATGGSCTYSPSSAGLNQGITWTAYPSGGNGSYGYSWSGTNLSGSGQTTTSSYGSAGTYPGSVTISSAGTQASPICTASGGGGGGPTIVAPPTCSVSNTNPQVNQAITYSASPSTSNPYTWTPTNSSMCTASNSSSETCTFTNASQFGMSVTDRYGQTGYCSTVTSGCIDGTPTLTATPNLVSGTGSGTGSSAVLSAGNMVANTSCVLTNATAGTTLHTYTEVNNACTVMSGQVTVSPTVQTKYCVSCDSGTPVCQVVNVAPTYQNF